MNILDKIVVKKKEEVDYLKQTYTLSEVKDSSHYNRTCYSLSDRLKNKNNLGIIAEFKRKSPSKGLINKYDHTPTEVATSYMKAGVTAISTLTDVVFFGAKPTDIQEVRASVKIPILRKDFMIDTYQIHEAKAMGADVILLIAAILSKEQASELASLSHTLGLQVLYEIHDISETETIPESVDIIGINNRDLKEFKVDYNHSIHIKNILSTTKPLISESGLSDPSVVHMLKEEGFDGFLIGEAFMKTKNPGQSCHEFINNVTHKSKTS